MPNLTGSWSDESKYGVTADRHRDGKNQSGVLTLPGSIE
jgi:hypothetical protein